MWGISGYFSAISARFMGYSGLPSLYAVWAVLPGLMRAEGVLWWVRSQARLLRGVAHIAEYVGNADEERLDIYWCAC